ncbi:MAG: 2-hydroxyacyl-CoA dehydratase [Firmicutes bacterium]|nr:2-hydroxyacyl-CoA dehydratase [Bacillota bacterium]
MKKNKMPDFAVFTKQMKKTHTILVPDMLPVHFGLLLKVFEDKGYKIKIIQSTNPALIEKGLKYVHNDICYPCLLTTGQLIDALDCGGFDTNNVALAMSQTGGGCRASNYIHLLRRGLKEAGYPQVPVLSINFSGFEKHNSLKFSLSMLKQARAAVVYGDMLYLMKNHYISYEKNKGDTIKKVKEWEDKLKGQLKGANLKKVSANLKKIKADFDTIETEYVDRVKVGIVGEIYVKFAPLGNNNLEQFLQSEGAEVVVPGLLGFILYCVANNVFDGLFYNKGRLMAFVFKKILTGLKKWDLLIGKACGGDKRFVVSGGLDHLWDLTKGVVDLGVKMGEGWLLPAEMMELIDSGVHNIVCAQPFGCLPNHIVGKSVIKRIKELRPKANITPIDYDASATRVNQENRVKLMLEIAKEELRTDKKSH